MLKINDANNFRRTLAGLSMIAAPLALLGMEVVEPEAPEALGASLATAAAHPASWLAANLLMLGGLLLLVPAILGMMHLTAERGDRSRAYWRHTRYRRSLRFYLRRFYRTAHVADGWAGRRSRADGRSCR